MSADINPVNAARIRKLAKAGHPRNHPSLEKAVMEFEREIILDALKRTTYVQTHAATMLGISRRMLKYRMDTLGISRPDNGPTLDPQLSQE